MEVWMNEMPPSLNRLDPGVRVVITGAGRGIGRAVAQRFAAEGARVTIADIDSTAAEAASQDIPASIPYRLDVADAEAVERFFAESEEPYEVIVANAGIAGPQEQVVDVDPADWKGVLDVNLNGVFNTVRSGARRLLRDARAGRIIVTASIAGLTAEPGSAAYCASKWAVIGFLKSAAIELAPHGILVNGACPGDVETGLLGEFGADRYRGPLGRSSQPEEIAGLYVWLASPDARYVVGETIVIDGGLLSTALVH
jgi:3-oxoacyl-[acyl-carrier protein] reductase